MFVRAYLRASTAEQDANRAREQLDEFAAVRGLTIASYYVENESGAALQRPALVRLLADSRQGDILLVEQVDRLSRLDTAGWAQLKNAISGKGLRVVALDLPTSFAMASAGTDEFTARMFEAMNGLMLDILAAVARKDYDDRRRRQLQGIEKAKSAGLYRGRREDRQRNAAILDMLAKGHTWTSIVNATSCSRSTISRLARREAVNS